MLLIGFKNRTLITCKNIFIFSLTNVVYVVYKSIKIT